MLLRGFFRFNCSRCDHDSGDTTRQAGFLLAGQAPSWICARPPSAPIGI